MAKAKFFTSLPEPILLKVQKDAKREGITPSEVVANIVKMHYESYDLLSAILTTYREARSANIKCSVLGEKLYGEQEWAGYREQIDAKVTEDIQRLFG
jgi:hypothetical protein